MSPKKKKKEVQLTKSNTIKVYEKAVLGHMAGHGSTVNHETQESVNMFWEIRNKKW
jgi:hypothetical protein